VEKSSTIENAEVENVGLEKAAPDDMGGKHGSRQHRSVPAVVFR